MASVEYSDVGSIRFLVGRHLDNVSSMLANAEGDGASLDTEALWLDALASYHTETDATFQKEWVAIQAAREKAPYQTGVDETQDLDFRMREMKAIIRSLARQGILTRQEAPTATWKPGA